MVELSPEQRGEENVSPVNGPSGHSELLQPQDEEPVEGEFVETSPDTNSKVKPIEIVNRNRNLILLTPTGEQIEVSTADFIRDIVQSYNEESSEIDSSFKSSAAKLQEQMSKADFKQIVNGISSDLAIRTVLARRYPGFSKLTMEEQDSMVLNSANHLGKLQQRYQEHMAQVAAINADEAMYHTMAEMFSGGYLGRLKGWLTVDSEIRTKMYQKVGDAMDMLLAAKYGKLNHEEVRMGLSLMQQLHIAKAEASQAENRAQIVTNREDEDYKFLKANNALQIRKGYIEATTEQIAEIKDIATDGLDKIVLTVTKRPAEALVYLFKETTGHTWNMIEKTADKGAELLRRGTNHVKDWFTDENNGVIARIFAMPRVFLQKISDPPVVAGASVGATIGGLGGYALGGLLLKGTEWAGYMSLISPIAPYLIYVPTIGVGIGGGVYGAWLIQNRIFSSSGNIERNSNNQNSNRAGDPSVPSRHSLRRPQQEVDDADDTMDSRPSLGAFRRRNR